MISNTQMKIVGNLALIDRTLFEIETAPDTREIERLIRVKDPAGLQSFFAVRLGELQTALENIRDQFDAAQVSHNFIASVLEQKVDQEKTLADALAAFEAEKAARDRCKLLPRETNTEIKADNLIVNYPATEAAE